jgi:hypothetical protein
MYVAALLFACGQGCNGSGNSGFYHAPPIIYVQSWPAQAYSSPAWSSPAWSPSGYPGYANPGAPYLGTGYLRTGFNGGFGVRVFGRPVVDFERYGSMLHGTPVGHR